MSKGRQDNQEWSGSVPKEHRDNVQSDPEAAAATTAWTTATAEATVITSGASAKSPAG